MRTAAPSTGERKLTPSSSMRRKRRQAEHLKAARIGQDRALPAHEAVQAVAMQADDLGTGPQHQVKGIAEHDLGTERLELLRASSP